jgi:monoamine oxidase
VPGAVQFTPTLDRKHEALAALASGAALKVILLFRRPFWEEIEGGRYRQAGFFQAPQAQFPTFWTALPQRVPMLVAWAGGPRARCMSGASVAEIVHCAVESAQSLFGTACEVASELAGAYVHDWQSDPHAAGAYSYVQVGGEGARKALAAPLADTLFFAGEATDYEGENGTVAGALQSGLRAARDVLASARKTSRTHRTRGKNGDRREPSAVKRSPRGRVV